MWRVEGRWGCAYLKRPRGGRAYRQERDAYRGWGAHLGRWMVPLLGHDDALRALLLGVAGGELVDQRAWSPSVLMGAFEEAGRFRKALDEAPRLGAPDPMPLAEAMRRRAEGWARRARASLSAEALRLADPDGLVRVMSEAGAWEDARRVACHRDFSPRNWALDVGARGGPRLTVLDFEHARADVALVDRLKLWDAWWLHTPALRTAFEAGYGRSMSERERVCFGRLVWLHGVSTLVWGHEHGELEFVALGQEVLARVAAVRRAGGV